MSWKKTMIASGMSVKTDATGMVMRSLSVGGLGSGLGRAAARNGIEAAGAERIAAQQAPGGEDHAAKRPELADASSA